MRGARRQAHFGPDRSAHETFDQSSSIFAAQLRNALSCRGGDGVDSRRYLRLACARAKTIPGAHCVADEERPAWRTVDFMTDSIVARLAMGISDFLGEPLLALELFEAFQGSSLERSRIACD